MPHLESKTKLIMTASVNWYINPKKNKFVILKINTLSPCAFFPRTFCEHFSDLLKKSAEIDSKTISP